MNPVLQSGKSMQDLYYKMHLIRECEERIRKEYALNEMKTPCHLGVGSEAIAVGITTTFPNAKYFGTYRNHALYLTLGGDLDKFWGELYGKETGCAKGKAGSMHLSAVDKGLINTSAVVGTTIPVAVGYALRAGKDNKSNREGAKEIRGPEVVSFFGDGATEEGVFHESLNFASLRKLRVLFVCEDNSLAIHNHKSHRHAYDMRKLVESYGIPYREVDGIDIDRVLKIANGLSPFLEHGPGFIHASYHRFYEHVGPSEDYSAGYRSRPKDLRPLDPIFLLENASCLKPLSLNDRREIRLKVCIEVNNALERARNAKFPALEELTKDVFEEI